MSEAKEDPGRRLWRLWDQGERPDLTAFLAEVGPLEPLDLAAVLCMDRRLRWLAGQRLPAEYYLGAYAAVASNEEAALDLVYFEYRLRQEQGEAVAVDEFLLRFPQYAEQLQLQIKIGDEVPNHPAPPDAGPEQGTNPAATKPVYPVQLAKAEAVSPSPSPSAEGPKTLPRGVGADSLPAALQKRIDDICNRFEAAWVKGRRPQVEDFLTEAAAAERPHLLRELLPLDVGYRRAHGDVPTADEYLERFPGLDPVWLAAAVAVPAAGAASRSGNAGPPLRRPRAHRIRCPHCHSPIQLIDERPHDVLCPGCGSSFRMQEAHGTVSAPSLRLGKFQLLERVGRGAFGAVWRALDLELERVVALKIPHAGLTISSSELQHFLDEARKVAKLRHPGIVTVHEVTTLQGLPVIVSDFISGVTLKDLLEVRRPSFEETARLIAEVAEALHHAHVMGLVHRDVKPANIMVERGRVEVDGRAGAADMGRPLMLDFGLALREEAEITMTVDGEIIGTPAYINPEQAAGRGHYADRRSDVFSLGVVLYEMLSGELPFRGSRAMLLDQVLHDDPRPPRRINERIPRDLETICLKALAKLPAQRYQTAADFSADLRRFLKGETIHARRAGRTEKLWRWCRRHPRDAALAGTVLGLLVLLAVGSTAAALWINRERQRGDKLLKQSLDVSDQLDETTGDILDEVPHMEQRQQDLLEGGLRLRIDLLKEKSSPADRKKLADAHHRMGDFHRQLGQVEDLKKARLEYEEAIAEFDQLTKDDSGNDADYRRSWAICLDDLGVVLKDASPKEAEACFVSAREKQEKLKDFSGKPEDQRELARTYNNYGIFLKTNGRRSEAKEKYEAALQLRQQLAAANENDLEHRSDLAQTLLNLGNWLNSKKEGGNAGKARDDYVEAIGHLKYLNDHSDKREYQFRRALASNALGEVLRQLGDYDSARRAHNDAIELLCRLTAEFPMRRPYHKELANAQNSLGVTERAAGRVAAAETALAQAREQFGLLLKSDKNLPDFAEYQNLAAQNLYNLGGLYLTEKKDPGTARPVLDEAVALAKQAWDANGRNPVYLENLRQDYYLRGWSLAKRGDHVQAAADARAILELPDGDDDASWLAPSLYAGCVLSAKEDARLDEAGRRTVADAYFKAVLDQLRSLPDSAIDHSSNLDDWPEFAALKATPEIAQISAEWEAKKKRKP